MLCRQLHFPTPRILIAARNDVTNAIAQAVAYGERCETVEVHDGVTAIHTLLGATFDLAIIDTAQPRLDGLRLIALIRATPCLRHLPILAVATEHQPDTTLEGGRAGADDYLPRPLEWPLLAMRIRQLTGQISPYVARSAGIAPPSGAVRATAS